MVLKKFKLKLIESLIGMQVISENKKKFTFGKKFKSVEKNEMLRNGKAEM